MWNTCQVHAAAESFAAWDLGRNGALSFEDFRTIIGSLAESSPLDETTVKRLFVLADVDSNGAIDMNEFLALLKRLKEQ